MGVPLSQVTTALSVFMGSQYVNDFDFNNRTYRVYAQADQAYPYDGEGSAQLLCAIGCRADDSAGQPVYD